MRRLPFGRCYVPRLLIVFLNIRSCGMIVDRLGRLLCLSWSRQMFRLLGLTCVRVVCAFTMLSATSCNTRQDHARVQSEDSSASAGTLVDTSVAMTRLRALDRVVLRPLLRDRFDATAPSICLTSSDFAATRNTPVSQWLCLERDMRFRQFTIEPTSQFASAGRFHEWLTYPTATILYSTSDWPTGWAWLGLVTDPSRRLRAPVHYHISRRSEPLSTPVWAKFPMSEGRIGILIGQWSTRNTGEGRIVNTGDNGGMSIFDLSSSSFVEYPDTSPALRPALRTFAASVFPAELARYEAGSRDSILFRTAQVASLRDGSTVIVYEARHKVDDPTSILDPSRHLGVYAVRIGNDFVASEPPVRLEGASECVRGMTYVENLLAPDGERDVVWDNFKAQRWISSDGAWLVCHRKTRSGVISVGAQLTAYDLSTGARRDIALEPPLALEDDVAAFTMGPTLTIARTTRADPSWLVSHDPLAPRPTWRPSALSNTTRDLVEVAPGVVLASGSETRFLHSHDQLWPPSRGDGARTRNDVFHPWVTLSTELAVLEGHELQGRREPATLLIDELIDRTKNRIARAGNLYISPACQPSTTARTDIGLNAAFEKLSDGQLRATLALIDPRTAITIYSKSLVGHVFDTHGGDLTLLAEGPARLAIGSDRITLRIESSECHLTYEAPFVAIAHLEVNGAWKSLDGTRVLEFAFESSASSRFDMEGMITLRGDVSARLGLRGEILYRVCDLNEHEVGKVSRTHVHLKAAAFGACVAPAPTDLVTGLRTTDGARLFLNTGEILER